MCYQTGRGRLENRIFGNGVFPEDGPDQILPRLILALRIGLSHKTAISRTQVRPRFSFGLHSTLREHNQGPAHRKMLCPGYTLDLNCQFRWMVTLWRMDDDVRLRALEALFMPL